MAKLKNMTLKEFKHIYSGEWFDGGICHKCGTILSDCLKNFTDTYLGFGVTGDKKLAQACEDYQRIEQHLQVLIHKHGFEFKDSLDEYDKAKEKRRRKSRTPAKTAKKRK